MYPWSSLAISLAKLVSSRSSETLSPKVDCPYPFTGRPAGLYRAVALQDGFAKVTKDKGYFRRPHENLGGNERVTLATTFRNVW